MDNLSTELGQKLELDYVKSSYDDIADKFSATRYKKWPKVDEFLKSLTDTPLLLDIGCGNGKYLDSPLSFNIGCDISINLLRICKSRGFEVVQCDMTRLPFRFESFDSIICIAALHHIVTHKRRQDCLEGMFRILRDSDSRLLIQVWSYEQELKKDNPYLSQNKMRESETKSENKVVIKEGLSIPIHKNRTPFQQQDLLVPFKVPKTSQQGSKKNDTQAIEHETRLRYYHVFKEKELESMISEVTGSEIIDSYYDCGNWCLIARRRV